MNFFVREVKCSGKFGCRCHLKGECGVRTHANKNDVESPHGKSLESPHGKSTENRVRAISHEPHSREEQGSVCHAVHLPHVDNKTLALLVHSRSYVNSSDSRSSIDSLLREIVTQ